jgi:hypothetical protein
MVDTDVSSMSSFDLQLIWLSTNVNSTWNQQKCEPCHGFRWKVGWENDKHFWNYFTLMTFCKSNQFSTLIQLHHIDFWFVETTLIQPVCVQGDLTPNHKSAKEDVKCLGLLWPNEVSDRVNEARIQSVNLCPCVCGQSVTWNRQTSMIQCPVLFCLNRCSLTHSDSNTYRQAGWPE